MQTSKAPRTIDQYIGSQAAQVQPLLQKVREAIAKGAPLAEEAIKYQIPTFVLNGNLVHFAAFRTHIGFYPAPSAIKHFESELSGYKTAKGSVQFPFDQAVPFALITQIVKFRVRENLAKASTKKKSG